MVKKTIVIIIYSRIIVKMEFNNSDHLFAAKQDQSALCVKIAEFEKLSDSLNQSSFKLIYLTVQTVESLRFLINSFGRSFSNNFHIFKQFMLFLKFFITISLHVSIFKCVISIDTPFRTKNNINCNFLRVLKVNIQCVIFTMA